MKRTTLALTGLLLLSCSAEPDERSTRRSTEWLSTFYSDPARLGSGYRLAGCEARDRELRVNLQPSAAEAERARNRSLIDNNHLVRDLCPEAGSAIWKRKHALHWVHLVVADPQDGSTLASVRCDPPSD